MNQDSKSVNHRPLRIGIVGSGITGLAAGWWLSKNGHHVELFEARSDLGMDSHGLDFFPDTASHSSVDNPASVEALRIDVPPRLFNAQLWPNLVKLYQQAGVETTPIDPSKGFADANHQTYLRLKSGYRPPISALLSPTVQTIARQANRLLDLARDWNQHQAWPQLSMQQLWQKYQFPRTFVDHFLYPALSATVCTCDFAALDQYPASILLPALLAMIDGAALQRARWGSQDVVQRLQAGLHIHFSTAVEQARLLQDDLGEPAAVAFRSCRGTHRVDHLIIATQANHVSQIVQDLTSEERQVLTSFRYGDCPVVVHRDTSLMPVDSSQWSHFNMMLNRSAKDRSNQAWGSDPDRQTRAMCTIWMNRFREDWNLPYPIFQTIMPLRDPAPELILGHARLQRPHVTMDSFTAWDRLQQMQLQTDRRIWFCGSYAHPGIPLLESGVASAYSIVQQILKSTAPNPSALPSSTS